MRTNLGVFIIWFFISFYSHAGQVNLKRASASERYEGLEKKLSQFIAENPDQVSLYSKRGDARMFLGDFNGSRNDYEKMIQLEPSLDVSHWRLGIAYFYLGLYEKAARQFEIYHLHDSIDRENGIWKFMSEYKSKGLKAAREGLLKYQKDDRPPYPLLYDMFAGRLDPADVFTKINQVDYPENYRVRVLFHALLYVGIYLELVEDNQEMAEKLLKKAFENEFGRSTGTYMWQVARLHYFQMLEKTSVSSAEKDSKVK